MKSLSLYVKRNPDCAWRVIDSQALIVKVKEGEGNKVFSLNKTGAVIWELANGEHSLAQITDHIKHRFEASENAQPRPEIEDFANELVERDLLLTSQKPF